MKFKNVWVVTDDASSVAELASGAAALGENTTLVYAGTRDGAVGASKAYWAGDLKSESFINYIPVIVELIKENRPELVLAGNSTNSRLAASFIAAANGTAVLSDASSLEIVDGAAVAKRMVYGGAAFKTDKCRTATAVAVLSAGAFEPAELQPVPEIVDLTAGKGGVTFKEKAVKEGKAINLSIAKKVIAVGRGIPDGEYLKNIDELASILDCAVGCTRPVAEEDHWMPKETYIGVSGVMMKPDFYIGIGISGQVQHTVGISSSKTIIAINKDKNAPIFEQCDYGIVGDLTKIVPGLIEKLK